ncbi:hypothetical protein ACTVBU_10890 [Sanguibacter sp. A246]|uniref:hypothetical protein n=1 Tax=Sanguibacter sp. A246 TaxID=3457326 RepID=UPI003FD741A1
MSPQGRSIDAVVEIVDQAECAVVVHTAHREVLDRTYAARAAKGPVHVFDPEVVTPYGHTLVWSPIQATPDVIAARHRAELLIDATEGYTNFPHLRGGAVDVLHCLLHAAALGGVSLSELYRWTRSTVHARVAVSILADFGDLALSRRLAAVIEEAPRRRDEWWFGSALSLAELDDPRVRARLEVAEGQDAWDAAEFVTRSGTLYIVGHDDRGRRAGLHPFPPMDLLVIADLAGVATPREYGMSVDPAREYLTLKGM